MAINHDTYVPTKTMKRICQIVGLFFSLSNDFIIMFVYLLL